MKKELQLKTMILRKLGYSVKELHEQIGVSKSTISRWVQPVTLSQEARKRLNDRSTKARMQSEITIREKTKQKNIAAMKYANEIVNTDAIDNRTQAILCSLIYYCEGNKEIRGVIFTNSDPGLIQSFLVLFRNSFSLDESKFRILMHLHDYHSEEDQKLFWSKITQIPYSQFNKSYRKSSDHKYKKEGYQGCIKVCYGDVSIARKLNAIAKTFMERYK